MAKKYKSSKLTASDEDFLAKGSKKERSIAVDGKPDQYDVDNLTAIFEAYDRYTGGRLSRLKEENRLTRALNNKHKEAPIATAEKFSFFMPQDLQDYIEALFPSIWTNKEHTRWFLKKFPEFRR